LNLFSLATRRAPAPVVKAPIGYDGGGGYYSPLGAAYSDAYRKDRVPQPRELIQELVGLAYRCVMINADAVAATPLRLYAKTGKGQRKIRFWKTAPITRKTRRYLERTKETAGHLSGGDEIEEVKDHPILRLLDLNQSAGSVDDDDYSDSRPALSGYSLIKLTQVYLEAIGRAYWLTEDDGLGVPSKIWLLRPHMVEEILDPAGSGRILYYQYGGTGGVKYDPSQILRFSDPDPNNPYVGGMSPLVAAIEKLRIYRRQDANINAILENAARPDAIFSPKGDSEGGATIGAAEARRIEVAMNQKFREGGNGSILVQPYPGTLQILGWKPGDVVEIERAKELKSEILFIFGVPNTIADRNDANLASAKTGDYALAKYATMPRCTSLASALRGLLRRYDPDGRLFLAFDNCLPDDEVFALEQFKAASSVGAVTRNEIRSACDLPDKPWGDMPLVPKLMVAVDPATGRPESAAPDPTSGNGANDGEADDLFGTGKTLAARLTDAGYGIEEVAALATKQATNGHAHQL
jgi:phage portal protein BeeE